MENNQERINSLRKRMKQIADIAVDYIPEISGAAAGAAFGNPVVGAVIGTAAKRMLKRFMIARTKKLNFEEAIQNNIERFGNATVAASGSTKKKNVSNEAGNNRPVLYPQNATISSVATYAFKTNITR